MKQIIKPINRLDTLQQVEYNKIQNVDTKIIVAKFGNKIKILKEFNPKPVNGELRNGIDYLFVDPFALTKCEIIAEDWGVKKSWEDFENGIKFANLEKAIDRMIELNYKVYLLDSFEEIFELIKEQ